MGQGRKERTEPLCSRWARPEPQRPRSRLRKHINYARQPHNKQSCLTMLV